VFCQLAVEKMGYPGAGRWKNGVKSLSLTLSYSFDKHLIDGETPSNPIWSVALLSG